MAVEQHERWQEEHRYLSMAFLKDQQRERIERRPTEDEFRPTTGIDAKPATPPSPLRFCQRVRVAPRERHHRIHEQILRNLTHTPRSADRREPVLATTRGLFGGRISGAKPEPPSWHLQACTCRDQKASAIREHESHSHRPKSRRLTTARQHIYVISADQATVRQSWRPAREREGSAERRIAQRHRAAHSLG